MSQQILFDLDFDSGAVNATQRVQMSQQRQLLQRAVLRWLEQQYEPKGLGTDVVTRVSRLKADVAAFWSQPTRNNHEEGPNQILVPTRTVIVQCHVQRDDCWPDCIRSSEILPKLKEAKTDRRAVEEVIRQQEPELRETNTLFEEYAEWHYEKSSNKDYHRVKRRLDKLEHALYHGTKFERIRSAQLADHLYLAVPAGVVEPAELADGWGLLWIEDDLNVNEVLSPEDRECLRSNRFHLVQNIAAAGKKSVLSLNGVHRSAKGDVVFTKVPRGHRREQIMKLVPAESDSADTAGKSGEYPQD